MVMVFVLAGGTHRILGLELIVWNPVENAGIQKLLQAAVNGSPVNLSFKFGFQVGMRQRMVPPKKGLKNADTLVRISQI